MKHYLATLIICLSFVGCTSKAKTSFFEIMDSVALDESKTVLMKPPALLCSISDSTIATLNSSQKLSLYNLYSGKNVNNFSLEGFNFDSLIEKTYRDKFKGIKKYTYETGYELNGNNYQLVNYYHTNTTFYVLVSLLVQVDDLKDDTTRNNLKSSAEAKNLKGLEPNSHIVIMDYVNFIFELSDQLQLKKVVPLYAETTIRKDNYYAYFHKNFIVDNDCIYVPISKNETSPNLEAKINTSSTNYSLAKISLQEIGKVAYLKSYADIDFSNYRLQDYFSTKSCFWTDGSRLSFSNGKEIVEVTTKTSLLKKNKLANNEWISSYSITGDKITLSTYTLYNNGSVIISGNACPIDSIVDFKIKQFDLSRGEFIISETVPQKSNEFCFGNNKLIFVSKNEKHYFLNYIKYHVQ